MVFVTGRKGALCRRLRARYEKAVVRRTDRRLSTGSDCKKNQYDDDDDARPTTDAAAAAAAAEPTVTRPSVGPLRIDISKTLGLTQGKRI